MGPYASGALMVSTFHVNGTLNRIESFSELATSTPKNPVSKTEPVIISPVPEPSGNAPTSELTEEEERELAELMGEDMS